MFTITSGCTDQVNQLATVRSGVHEDDKRVIKSGRESRSGRGGASEGVVGDMNVEGGNRGPAVPIVSDY